MDPNNNPEIAQALTDIKNELEAQTQLLDNMSRALTDITAGVGNIEQWGEYIRDILRISASQAA